MRALIYVNRGPEKATYTFKICPFAPLESLSFCRGNFRAQAFLGIYRLRMSCQGCSGWATP